MSSVRATRASPSGAVSSSRSLLGGGVSVPGEDEVGGPHVLIHAGVGVAISAARSFTLRRRTWFRTELFERYGHRVLPLPHGDRLGTGEPPSARSGGGRLRLVPKLLGDGFDFVERFALFLEVFLEEADRLALA